MKCFNMFDGLADAVVMAFAMIVTAMGFISLLFLFVQLIGWLAGVR